MNSSLAYTANQRVERYRKSVEFVAEDVLLYKGFLGRSLKEREGLSSVGTRAARAAGVIVDSLGKLRCPPGTPNANQFTDLQMSNCMVPGLGAARRAAQKLANSTQSLIDNAQKILRGPDGKKLKGKAKVAALASLVALDVMDYMNMDGSGSLSASTLALAEVLRYGSSEIAEAVLDRLVRQGKITKTQRKNLDAILDKVAATERFAGVAEYLTGRAEEAVKRRRRAKPTRRDNRVPDVDLTLGDMGQPKQDMEELIDSVTPKLKAPRHLEVNSLGSADLSTILPSAPEQSIRPAGFAQITVDAERFNAELKQKTNALLDKHGIDKNLPPSQQIDELAAKMGVVMDVPIEKQLDIATFWMQEDGMAKAQSLLEPDPNHSAEINAYRAIKGQAIIDAINATKNDTKQPGWLKKNAEGREALRQAIAQGYLEALVGFDEIFKDSPDLKNGVILAMHGVSDPVSMNDAAGYAQVVIRDGKAMARVVLVPDSMIFDQTKLSVMPQGQGMSHTLRFMGADDHQVGLAIHEGAHAEHFMHQFRTMGVEIGKDTPTLSEQARLKGSKLSDSYIGLLFARKFEFPKDATWDEVEEEIKSKRKRVSFRNFTEGPEHNLNQYLFDVISAEALKNRGAAGAPELSSSELDKLAWGTTDEAKYAIEIIEAVENYERDLMFPNVNPFVLPGEQYNTMSRERADAVRQQAIDAVELKLPQGYELVDEDGNPITKQQLVDAVKQATGGKKLAQVSQEYKPILDSYLGIDTQKISTNGVDNQEVMRVLGVASQYGQTNVMEAVAESRLLDVFTRQFGSFRPLDDSPKQAREMLGRLFPKSYGDRPRGAPPSAAEYQERIQKIIASMPKLRRGQVDVS